MIYLTSISANLDEFLNKKIKNSAEKLTKLHYQGVINRKAINNLKFHNAKEHMLKNKDFTTIKNYQTLKECEEKPLIDF